MANRCFRLVSIGVLIGLAGCSNPFGPEKIETGTVRGRVLIRGVPYTTGWLEFVPVDGTVGRSRSARIGRDGGFLARRVPAGQIGVKLAGPRPPQTGDARLDNFLFLASRVPLIHRDVKAIDAAPLTIELNDEADEFQRRYAAQL